MTWTKTLHDGESIALLGIIANIWLTLIKLLGGIFGNSYALIADAIESGTDIIGSLIVYFGVRLSQAPADHNHPYGHGKLEPMAGFAVSIILLFAIIEIFRGAIERIRHPEVWAPAMWTLAILIGVVILKWGLFIRAWSIGSSLKSTALKGDAMHHLSDAITTAIALIGTMIAVFVWGVYTSAGDYAALVAGCFMLYNAWHIGSPAVRELLDEMVDPEMEDAVGSLVLEHRAVKNVNLCIVRKSGFDRIIELHLFVDGEMSVRAWHLIAHEVENDIKKHFGNIQSVLVHIEPNYEVVN
jgi:cation diffusion facilitator family transporter